MEKPSLPPEMQEKVLEHLDLSGLLNCRQVQRSWNKICSNHLKNLHPVIKFSYKNDLRLRGNPQGIFEFYLLMEGRIQEEFPFSKFKFDLKTEMPWQSGIALFAEKYGIYAKHYTISFGNSGSLNLRLRGTKLLELLFNKSPNIESLEFRGKCNLKGLKLETPLPNLKEVTGIYARSSKVCILDELVAVAPNLHKLELDLGRHPKQSSQSTMLLNIRKVLHVPFLVFQNIEVNLDSRELLQTLLQSPPKITQSYLRITIACEDYGDESEEVLELTSLWISTLSGTLETADFVLKGDSDYRDHQLVIPYLEKLEKLSITDNYMGEGFTGISCLNPLNFPNLNSVEISMPRPEILFNRLFHGVKSLSFKCRVPSLRFLFTQAFPNIQKLELELPTTENLEFIFTKMTQLKHLQLGTGFSLSEVWPAFTGGEAMISKSENDWLYSPLEEVEAPENDPAVPSLANMKDLETLMLWSESWVDSPRVLRFITYLSATKKLKRLSKLQLKLDGMSLERETALVRLYHERLLECHDVVIGFPDLLSESESDEEASEASSFEDDFDFDIPYGGNWLDSSDEDDW